MPTALVDNQYSLANDPGVFATLKQYVYVSVVAKNWQNPLTPHNNKFVRAL
jgi:hypothetical protein